MPKSKAKIERMPMRVKAGAMPPEGLGQTFPPIRLSIKPPYPPMEAKSVEEIPSGPGWLYEPKWDGFRCLAFRSGSQVLLQSKAGQPLGRYFPELVAALRELPQPRFVLDGEIIIFSDGHLSFDDLLLRIHPAESRIRKLSAESPATLMCFDLLVASHGKLLTNLPLADRRSHLGDFFRHVPKKAMARLSPASADRKHAEQRKELKSIVEPQIGGPGFTGHAPGGPSRWSTKRSTEWQPLKPKLVCEAQYDHFSGGRFRHGTKFLRWRPEKKPTQCTFEQV